MKKFIIRHKKFRKINKDIKYDSITVSLFINFLMFDGKKNKSMILFYSVLEKLKKHFKLENEEMILLLKNIIKDCNPGIRIKKVKRGGGTYQVPYTLKFFTGYKIAIKKIIRNSRKRKEKTIINKIFFEIIDSKQQTSETYKNKIEILKIAKKNQAFANLF